MYSPKIKEDLIPVLYKLAKRQGKPMTRVVDGILITLKKIIGLSITLYAFIKLHKLKDRAHLPKR